MYDTGLYDRELRYQQAELGDQMEACWRVCDTWPHGDTDLLCIEHGGAFGVDHGGFVVLGALRALGVSNDAVTLGELSRILGWWPMAVAGSLANLEYHGWVCRLDSEGQPIQPDFASPVCG